MVAWEAWDTLVGAGAPRTLLCLRSARLEVAVECPLTARVPYQSPKIQQLVAGEAALPRMTSVSTATPQMQADTVWEWAEPDVNHSRGQKAVPEKAVGLIAAWALPTKTAVTSSLQFLKTSSKA